jgi:hopene-associated glycosyltransferase HpnB
MLTTAAAAAAAIWLVLLLLPWRPWSVREQLSATAATDNACDLSAITVLIPARDEAGHIETTVKAAASQGGKLRIIVIDDQSRDATARLAAAAGAEVIAGTKLPEGWTGKLWALQQGLEQTRSELILQLDADIHLAPGMLAALQQKLCAEKLALASIMALLPTANVWQRMLLPAYVWFFKLLYPFALANAPGRRFAAAAGGCILLRRQALLGIGGYQALAGAIIDDCTLAAAVKRQGGRTWLGLSRDVISHRDSGSASEIGKLIKRTAYTQLQQSTLLLLLTTLAMLLIFWVPVVALLLDEPAGQCMGLLAIFSMLVCYRPMLRFYRLPAVYALLLPLIAAFYLFHTWLSAVTHWRGHGAEWKQRHYP